MSEKRHLKALVKEAEVYRSQGLLDQACTKYREILAFVKRHARLSKDKKLIDALNQKIRAVEDALSEMEAAEERPQLTDDMQHLIRKLFAFSRSKDQAEIEGAIALAKFGQYDKAIEEFQRLIREKIMPLQAAMNLIRCYMTLSAPDEAVSQFKVWSSRDLFSRGDLKYLRNFLESSLSRKGTQADLPQIEGPVLAKKKRIKQEEEAEAEILALSSVSFPLPRGPRKGESVEFEVTFQSGSAISIVISSREKDLEKVFEQGVELTDIQCFSSMGVFKGNGTVSGKSSISSGPKRGDFAVDISIHED